MTARTQRRASTGRETSRPPKAGPPPKDVTQSPPQCGQSRLTFESLICRLFQDTACDPPHLVAAQRAATHCGQSSHPRCSNSCGASSRRGLIPRVRHQRGISEVPISPSAAHTCSTVIHCVSTKGVSLRLFGGVCSDIGGPDVLIAGGLGLAAVYDP